MKTAPKNQRDQDDKGDQDEEGQGDQDKEGDQDKGDKANEINEEEDEDKADGPYTSQTTKPTTAKQGHERPKHQDQGHDRTRGRKASFRRRWCERSCGSLPSLPLSTRLYHQHEQQ